MSELNLFEKFEGADLDRLIECLKAIKDADLKVDKYCQAGVNQNSGNVWVWSEDWPGCVYCSIGFDVHCIRAVNAGRNTSSIPIPICAIMPTSAMPMTKSAKLAETGRNSHDT